MDQMMNNYMVKLIWSKEGQITSKRAREEQQWAEQRVHVWKDCYEI